MIPLNYEIDRFKTRHLWVTRAGLPTDMVGTRFRGTEKLWHPEVSEIVTDWLKHFRSGERPAGRGLLLVGPPGRGKSTLAGCVLQEALLTAPYDRLGHHPDRGRAHTRPGQFAAYARIMAMQRKTFGVPPGEWTPELRAVEDAVASISGLAPAAHHNARLAVFDDLGKEHTTDSGWAENSFDLILRTREAEGWPSIVTSNVKPDDWTETYGESMGSFLHQAFDVIRVRSASGRDMRLVSS